MIRRSQSQAPRRGLSLLEVLISLTIFLMSLTALNTLLNIATNQAVDAARRNHAGRLCQYKLHSLMAGVIDLGSSGDQPFDPDETPDDGANYTWSVDAEQNTIPNLWSVTVTVSWNRMQEGSKDSLMVSQMIVDPTIRGSTQDSTPVLMSDVTASSSSSSSSSSTTGSTGSTGSTAGGSMACGGAPATATKSTGGASAGGGGATSGKASAGSGGNASSTSGAKGGGKGG